MKFKFSWGSGIAVIYGIFFLVLITFVAFTFYQKWDLVSGDYYQEEIKYQEKIEQKNRTKKLSDKLVLQVNKDQKLFILTFPSYPAEEAVEGTVFFYRPADARADRQFPLRFNQNGIQKIDIQDFPSGNWQVKVEWQVRNQAYIYEQRIIL